MKDYPYWTESLLISQEMNRMVFDRDYTVNHEGLHYIQYEKEGDTRISCYPCNCEDMKMRQDCNNINYEKYTGLGWKNILINEWEELQLNHNKPKNKDLLAELNQALFDNWMEINRPMRELEESKKWIGINNYCSILNESKNKS